jgi:L-ascorbate metabolism protein UlaG (beta-lactamase superfamily)
VVEVINRRNFIAGAAALLGLSAVGADLFIHRPEFGRQPNGARLKRIESSPHYKNGQFQCLEPIENIMEGDENRFVALGKFLFEDKKKERLFPETSMLSAKTDLKALPASKDCIVWMGHSSFYMQLGGRRILIDPVFSDFASPLFFINKAFAGSNVYRADDLPDIDILALSHDHWDHLDYPTIMSMKNKIGKIVCPLGVGEYFEQWGFSPEQIHEEDWFKEIKLADDFSIHVLPSQHFSGRFLTPNATQWGGFSFITNQKRVYYSGDGGYGEHFKTIGKIFGGFDLAIIENGQYNEAWHRVHLLPEESAKAAQEVGAKVVLSAHNGKFALARHAWDEPYRAFKEASQEKNYELITPQIGEIADIGRQDRAFSAWWEDMM